MWFIVLGVLLITLKLADVGFAAEWTWWAVLSPFALAAVWWAYADSSGLTKKREMDKIEDKKAARRRKNMEALGLDSKRQKADETAMRARRNVAQRIENVRTVKREHNEQTIKDSVFDSSRSTGFGDQDAGAKKEP